MNSVIAKLLRRMLPLAVLSVPLTLLVLSACGGGGGSGGGSSASSAGTSVVGAHQMGGAVQGMTLNLATASAVVSTLAGVSSLNTAADGIGQAARFNGTNDSIADGAGDLFVLDTGNNIIRKIVIATGATTTVAGKVGVAGAADGTGLAATFNNSNGIATDGTSLYVSDFTNNKIRKITPSSGTLANMTSANAVVTSLTGAPNTAMTAGAGDGTLASATFNGPYGLAIDSTHTNLYVADSNNNKIRVISLTSQTVTSLTGAASAVVALGSADSTIAASVSFNRPLHLAIDSSNINLYVTDAINYKIRKVVVATGATSSLTGAANTAVIAGAADSATATAVSFLYPVGIAIDSTNSNLYVADMSSNKIRQVALTGTPGATSSYTGTANTQMGAGFADGAAAAARFNVPLGVATDGANLYVADAGNTTIRQIVLSSGQVTTLAGSAPTNYSADGAGTAAKFDLNSMGATDGVNLYVTECGIVYTRVRKVEIATGKVTTLAGNTTWTSVDGTGTAATLNCPVGITTDGINLYIAESNGFKIRKIAPSSGTLAAMTSANAVVTTLAGSTWGAVDGTGLAATFFVPRGITTDGVNLYIADNGNNNLRKIAPASGTLAAMTSANAVVTTLAGSGTSGWADGTGTAATFSSPNGITTDGKVLFVADLWNNKIRRIAPSSGTLAAMTSANAQVSSLTGASGVPGGAMAVDGPASGAAFNNPGDITTDGTNLYVADVGNQKIRMIAPAAGATLSTMTSASAVVSSVTGASGVASAVGYADGAAATASFKNPRGIVTDGISLYVQDTNSGTVRRIK